MRRSIHTLSIAAAIILAAGASAQNSTSGTSDPALRAYLTGNGLLNRGMYELAAAEYRGFLEASPQHEKAPLARYGLAVALFRTKDLGGAEEQLRTLTGLRGFEFEPEARIMLGQCQLAAGEHADAAESFGAVLKGHADHDLADDAAGLRVEALYRAGKHDEAVRAADDMAGTWPNSPLRARAELFAGSSLMAEAEYADAAARFEALLSRGGAEGEVGARATLLLAQSLHRAGKRDEARPRYEKVVQAGDARLVPDALLGLGSLHLEQGRPREAGQTLDRLLSQFEQSPLAGEARLRRARACFELGDYAKSAELLNRVEAETKGGSDEAAYWLAKCDLRAEHYRESADRLQEATRRFPESRLLPEMNYDRAVALLKAGDAPGARAALDSFRDRFGEHALVPASLHLSASLAHQEGDYAECLAACGEFTRRFPKDEAAPAVEFLAAESLLLSGDEEDAAKAYTAFLQRHAGDPRAEKAAFRLGCTLHGLGKGDEARPHLERVARGKQTPEEFRPALLLLGDLAFASGDWPGAERLLGEYLSLAAEADGADDALLKLGLARARQNRHADALKAFDQLLARGDQSPHRTQALFERGQALVALKRPDEAAAAFTGVLESDPRSRFAPYAHNHLGAIESGRGDREAAAGHFAKAAELGEGTDLEADALFEQARALAAAGKHAEAEHAFTRLLEEYPSHRLAPEASARLAIAASRQDRHEQALEAIERAERSHAASLPSGVRDALAYEKAWCLRKLGRPEEAAPICRDLMGRAEPELRAHAAVDLATIEADAGRYADAAQILRSVLASKPPEDLAPRATYQLGVCAFRTDKFDEAAHMMERFFAARSEEADPSLAASASLVAGESLLKLGKHKQAAEHLRRVVDGAKGDPARPAAMLRLGECLAMLQLWPESERVFRQYLSEFGTEDLWFQAKFGLAWAVENQGRVPEAIAAYSEVVDRHQGPTAARAQFQIGECLFAQKKHEDAARELLKVDILYDYPEWSAAALYEAGRCFEALNDIDKARSAFEQVREKHAQTRWASLAGERLAATKTRPVPGR